MVRNYSVKVLDPAHDKGALDQVKRLWRRNSDTLGFFTDGAFDEYAARRQILYAVSVDGVVSGYVLYRNARGTAVVVHLCVHHQSRGQGVARALVEALKRETRHAKGIGLSCRRDFSATQLWPALGFVAQYDRPGRGRNRALITYWWYDHGHPSLFDTAVPSENRSVRVVIDANVFFDLSDLHDDESTESKALLEDWVASQIALLVTKETLNEINRNPILCERNRQRRRYADFEEARETFRTFSESYEAVAAALPPPKSEQDASDRRQLAWAVASDVSIFVTRDQKVLDYADDIYEAVGLKVVRPSTLVVDLDAIEREASYRPARLAGTTILHARALNHKESSVVGAFQETLAGESRGAFLRRYREVLSKPREWSVFTIVDEHNRLLALYAIRELPNTIHVSLLRVRPGALASTIVRQIAARLVRLAASGGCRRVTITDPFLRQEIVTALAEEGFVQTRQNRVERVLLYGVMSLQEATAAVGAELSALGVRQPVLSAPDQAARLAAEIERSFWPLRVAEAELPCFIIPIRPHWARELFDEGIAAGDLFGATAQAALLPANVYYRSARRVILQAPGRVLWYVTTDGRIPQSGSLRAVSSIDAVTVGTPKEIFRTYRRYGVYEWKQINQLAKGNLSERIMAVEFSKTELLPSPIPFNDLANVLARYGLRLHVRSPWRIPEEVFFVLSRDAVL